MTRRKVKRGGARKRPTPTVNADPILAAITAHKGSALATALAIAADEFSVETTAVLHRRGVQTRVDDAMDVQRRATWRLAECQPTTLAGASALLSHVAGLESSGLLNGMADHIARRNWQFRPALLLNVAAAVAKIGGATCPGP